MILKRIFAWLVAATVTFAPIQANASQNNTVITSVGPMTMATFVSTYLNPALASILSLSSGTTAPTNSTGGAPQTYQFWVNTSASPSALEMYDGAQWVSLGTINTSTHAWTPSGASSLPSATTSQLYGGTGSAGSAQAVTVGSGLSVSGGTLSAVSQASTVRQTVQAGPGAGSPSFLPSTAASLSLTSQNISTGSSALVVSSANGWSTSGDVNSIGVATSNLTWSGLTASTTNYLFVTVAAGSLTPGLTTLQPIYQFGGTIAVTSGQYTFDVAQMKMFLGNGTVANQVNVVFVGEAVTGASTVTSTIAYQYNGYYVSALQTWPSNATPINLNHNIGAPPEFIITNWKAVCITTNLSYPAGSELQIENFTQTTSSAYVGGTASINSRLSASYNTAGGAPSAAWPYGGGSSMSITAADWNMRLYARRSF